MILAAREEQGAENVCWNSEKPGTGAPVVLFFLSVTTSDSPEKTKKIKKKGTYQTRKPRLGTQLGRTGGPGGARFPGGGAGLRFRRPVFLRRKRKRLPGSAGPGGAGERGALGAISRRAAAG